MEVREIKATKSLTDRRKGDVRQLLRVAPYCRVSTDKDDQLHSYHSQVQYYTDLVKNKENWELVDVYADEGITGTMVKRREDFQRMINDCLDGKIDMVITKSISRFARNTLDTLKFVRLLKEKNIAVFFEEENINTMTMDGELLLTILSSVAQQEVENLSENVKKGLKMKMKRGELVGFQGCIGFDYDKETKSIYINEEEAETVRFIFNRYIEGAGTTIIARELNEKGIKTKKGKNWTSNTLVGVIKNEKYKGDLLLGKTFTVDPISKRRLMNYGEEDRYYISNHHEPIVSPDIFDAAQELMKYRSDNLVVFENGIRLTSKHSRKYPFSSKMKCAFCGDIYSRRTWHSGTKYDKIVWSCLTVSRHSKADCPYSKAIPEEEIKKAFVESYKLMCGKNKDLVEKFLSRVEEVLGEKAIETDLKKVKSELKKLNEKKKRLVELHISGKIDEEIYTKKYNDLEKKIIDFEKVRDGMKSHEKAEEQLQERIIEFRKLLNESQSLDEFDPQIFNCLVKNIIVGGYDEEGNEDPYKLIFVYRSNFESVYTGYKGRKRKKRKSKNADDEAKDDDADLCSTNNDEKEEFASNQLDDACRGSIVTPKTERVKILEF